MTRHFAPDLCVIGAGSGGLAVAAGAAHCAALDQHHLGTHLGGARGHRQPAGTGADDAKVGRETPGHAGLLARQRL